MCVTTWLMNTCTSDVADPAVLCGINVRTVDHLWLRSMRLLGEEISQRNRVSRPRQSLSSGAGKSLGREGAAANDTREFCFVSFRCENSLHLFQGTGTHIAPCTQLILHDCLLTSLRPLTLPLSPASTCCFATTGQRSQSILYHHCSIQF